jgi:hypothetical protein
MGCTAITAATAIAVDLCLKLRQEAVKEQRRWGYEEEEKGIVSWKG